jgi:hypothetical protein
MASNENTTIQARIEKIKNLNGDMRGNGEQYEAASLAQTVPERSTTLRTIDGPEVSHRRRPLTDRQGAAVVRT